MATYITKTYDRLDKIVNKRYGDTKDRIVEYVLEKNPGLELYGLVLPEGITVNLPDRPKSNKSSIRSSRRSVSGSKPMPAGFTPVYKIMKEGEDITSNFNSRTLMIKVQLKGGGRELGHLRDHHRRPRLEGRSRRVR